MTSIEILSVALSEVDDERLRGRNIEAPKTQHRIEGDSIHVAGWVLGQSSSASTVEIVHDGMVLRSVPIDVQRPDLVAAFPDASEAEQSGFRTNVPIPASEKFELLVRAVLQDEETVSLGIIRARQGQGSEEVESESSVQGPPRRKVRERPKTSEGFFRRFFGRGGG